MKNISIILLLIFSLLLALNYSWLEPVDTYMRELLKGNEFLHVFHFFGNYKFAAIVIVLTLLFASYKKSGTRFILFILYNYGAMLLVNNMLKEIIKRPRPEITDQLSSYSMPSAHTMTAFTIALVSSYLWSKLVNQYNKMITTILIIFAFLCGLSRIADERHFFTDVFVGAILSCIIYSFAKGWYEKKPKSIK